VKFSELLRLFSPVGWALIGFGLAAGADWFFFLTR
jgi:hypothetical protein